MKSTSRNIGNEYSILALICASVVLIGLRYRLNAAFYSSTLSDPGLDRRQIGALTFVYALTSVFGPLVTGPLSDCLGRRKLLIGALAAFSLLSSLSWVAHDFPVLLLIQASMGMVTGTLLPTSMAIASEACAPARRGLNLGLLASLFVLAGIAPISPTLIFLLIVPFWNGALTLLAIPGLIVTVLMAKALTRVPEATRGPAVHAAAYFRARNVRLSLLATCCIMASLGTLESMSGYDGKFLNMPSPYYMLSVTGLGGFCGFVIPALSGRIGRKRMAMASFILLTLLTYAFHACHTDLSPNLNPNILNFLADTLHVCRAVNPSFALTFVIFFLACGIQGLMIGPIVAEGAPPGLSASAIGLVLTGSVLLGDTATYIPVAIAKAFGFDTTQWIAIGTLALGAAASFFLVETAPRKARSAKPAQS